MLIKCALKSSMNIITFFVSLLVDLSMSTGGVNSESDLAIFDAAFEAASQQVTEQSAVTHKDLVKLVCQSNQSMLCNIV
jgi:hypothetical protein